MMQFPDGFSFFNFVPLTFAPICFSMSSAHFSPLNVQEQKLTLAIFPFSINSFNSCFVFAFLILFLNTLSA